MKEGKSQKNFKISIRAKILTGMIACVLIVTNLIGWFFIVQAKDTLLEQCKNNARNSAKIAAERIDGDILGQIKAGDEKTENYKEILSQLQDFLCGDDIKYIYTMRMNGDRLEFIVDADTEEGAAIGEEYEIYDEIAEAFDGNATVDSEMTSDEWGDFYSAFAPVYNSSGEIAGIVGVDCSATDIRLQENIFIKEFVIIELAGLVENLQDKIINAYYNYKGSLSQLKETRSRSLLYNKNYAKAMDDEDFLEVSISSSLYQDMQIEEEKYMQMAKKYHLELQRLAGKKVVDGLNLYQYNYDSALIGGNGNVK